jgi:hypothetical protein
MRGLISTESSLGDSAGGAWVTAQVAPILGGDDRRCGALKLDRPGRRQGAAARQILTTENVKTTLMVSNTSGRDLADLRYPKAFEQRQSWAVDLLRYRM